LSSAILLCLAFLGFRRSSRSPGCSWLIDPVPEHPVMPLDPFDVLGVRQQQVANEFQQGGSQFRSRAAKVENGSLQLGGVGGIAVFEPLRVEINVFPPPRNDGFGALMVGAHYTEEDASAVAAGFVAVHLEKSVFSGRKSEIIARRHRNGSSFPLCDFAELLMEVNIRHTSSLRCSPWLQRSLLTRYSQFATASWPELGSL